MVSLLTTKMCVPAGRVVLWDDWPRSDRQYWATVEVPGPVASSVWARNDRGEWLCLRWSGHRQRWERLPACEAAVEDQRVAIVNEMVETELRFRASRYRWVPGPEHMGNDSDWTRARLEHDLRVLAELRERFWAELYPNRHGGV